MTMSISNANASYISSLVANAQNNIKTEKELQAKLAQAPTPNIASPKKKKVDDSTFYKGMAALAVGGTLLVQTIALLKKPEKTQGENIAKMSEAIEKIAQEIGKLQKALGDVSDKQTKIQSKVSGIDLAGIQKELKELQKAVKDGTINEAQFIKKIQNIISDNNTKLNTSLEEIVKKYTKEVTAKMPSLKGIEESLEQIKKQLAKPGCDVSKELSEIKTLLSKMEPAKMPTEDLAEIKALLQKLDAFDEVSKKLGEIKIDSETILQKIGLLGDDITEKINLQKQGITEIKAAITRMVNGAITTPKATQIADETNTADIDIDLIAKVISSQIYDSSGIDKIQINYQELVELLKDKTYGQNFEYIAAKFDELVNSIQELNSTKPQKRLGSAYSKLQDALLKAKKEKSLTTDAIFKNFFTPIEQIDFARGEARLKATGEKFSGTVVSFEKLREFEEGKPLPTGSRFLMTYADGRLVRSSKYDARGNELFKKVYSYDVKPLKDSTEFHTKVKRIHTGLNGKKEMSSFQNIDTRSDSDGSLIRKRFNKMIIDYKDRKANEVTRYNEEFGRKTLYRETPEGNFVTIIGKDGKRHTIDYAAPFEKFNKNVNGLATSYIKVLSDEELDATRKTRFLARLFSEN